MDRYDFLLWILYGLCVLGSAICFAAGLTMLKKGLGT